MDRSASILAINVPEPCPLLLPLFTVSSSCLWGWVCGEGGGGVSCFSYHGFFWVSSLAYPTCLGQKSMLLLCFYLCTR
jgi:hypothetical protein